MDFKIKFILMNILVNIVILILISELFLHRCLGICINILRDISICVLQILQAENIKYTEIKKFRSEYFMKVKILKSKLSRGHTIKTINIWIVPVIRHTAGIVYWAKAELKALDKRVMIRNQGIEKNI